MNLLDVADRHDPIAEGDKIFSPIYGANLKRSIALIGRFSYPYTKPMIKKILEDLGNEVKDDVNAKVDLVIVGMQDPSDDGVGLKPIEEIPGYKEAQKYHIELITIHKIRHLLKLGE